MMIEALRMIQQQMAQQQQMLLQQQHVFMKQQQEAFVRQLQQAQPTATSPVRQSASSVPPPAKIEFQEFSGDVEDRNAWSEVRQAQLSALGCASARTAQQSEEIKLGRNDFDSDGISPEKLQKANQVCVPYHVLQGRSFRNCLGGGVIK